MPSNRNRVIRRIQKKGGETRRLWVKKYAAEVIREMFDVPGCRAVIRLDKKVRCKGEEPSWEIC
jgi:hypothetical protein